MGLELITGGSDYGTDGTVVSQDGARTNPLLISAVNTPVAAHVRCSADTWSQDQEFTIPDELEISFDGGTTWYGSADNAIPTNTGVGLGGLDVGDLNEPVLVRQITGAPSTAGSLDTDGTTTAATALTPNPVAGLTVTPGNAQNVLAWTAVTNRTRYQVDRATNSGFTTGVTLGVYTGTAAGFTDTGLTNGTTYYYRVKAIGTYRYSDTASWATGSGAPLDPIFASDNFNTGTGDLVGTTPDIGADWFDTSNSGSPSPVYDANKIRQQDAATAFTSVGTTPASNNYKVEADIIPQAAGSSGVSGVHARKNAGTGPVTAYVADYYDHPTTGTRQWRLYKVVAGTTTVLGTYTENIGTTTKRLTLEVNGSAITLYVDGVARVTGTDTAIAGPGRAGVNVGNASSNTNGPWIDNFVATLI